MVVVPINLIEKMQLLVGQKNVDVPYVSWVFCHHLDVHSSIPDCSINIDGKSFRSGVISM